MVCSSYQVIPQYSDAQINNPVYVRHVLLVSQFGGD